MLEFWADKIEFFLTLMTTHRSTHASGLIFPNMHLTYYSFYRKSGKEKGSKLFVSG